MNKDFWMNKKVLVTGHNGFKGSWLIKWLDMMGAKTIGFSLSPEEESGFQGMELSENYTEITGDIRDKSNLEVLSKLQPEIVFHLAAQAIVGKAKENPLFTFETNLMGTVNLLEVLRNIQTVKSIVVVTSDKVYENTETMDGYVEGDSLMGSEPYSCSKVCEEQAAKAYFESYFKEMGVGVATARASNAFGGGDYHFDRLIPYLQKCAFEHEVPSIRNPQSLRPWQYVLDLLYGYMVLARKLYENGLQYAGVYNFGPQRDELYTVGDIADMICGKIVQAKKQNYYEAGLLFIDSAKSNRELGWKPIYSVNEGIQETKIAYEDYFLHRDSNLLYENRIQAFINRMAKGITN